MTIEQYTEFAIMAIQQIHAAAAALVACADAHAAALARLGLTAEQPPWPGALLRDGRWFLVEGSLELEITQRDAAYWTAVDRTDDVCAPGLTLRDALRCAAASYSSDSEQYANMLSILARRP